jgi:hypothetical protein
MVNVSLKIENWTLIINLKWIKTSIANELYKCVEFACNIILLNTSWGRGSNSVFVLKISHIKIVSWFPIWLSLINPISRSPRSVISGSNRLEPSGSRLNCAFFYSFSEKERASRCFDAQFCIYRKGKDFLHAFFIDNFFDSHDKTHQGHSLCTFHFRFFTSSHHQRHG